MKAQCIVKQLAVARTLAKRSERCLLLLQGQLPTQAILPLTLVTFSTCCCFFRDSYLYIPPTYTPGLPSPLLVMLHGAGGHGKNTLATFGKLSVFDESRCLLLVPESRSSRTWDMIRWGDCSDVLSS
jgi:poly(3-hydroxybutyrate) depolymerase